MKLGLLTLLLASCAYAPPRTFSFVSRDFTAEERLDVKRAIDAWNVAVDARLKLLDEGGEVGIFIAEECPYYFDPAAAGVCHRESFPKSRSTICLDIHWLRTPYALSRAVDGVSMLRITMQHEVGHELGLDHVPEPNRVMFISVNQPHVGAEAACQYADHWGVSVPLCQRLWE